MVRREIRPEAVHRKVRQGPYDGRHDDERGDERRGYARCISDYQMFPPLLKRTTAGFNVVNVSADKAYSGRSNFAAMEAVGVKPLIPFKSNANSRGSELWKQTFEFFRDNRDEFLKQYHKRSNVETTFSMIKAKFGAFVRCKTPTAQVNEILCKVLAHNLCVLVQSFFELGIEPQFWQSGTAALAEARPVGWFRNLPERQPWSGPRRDSARRCAIWRYSLAALPTLRRAVKAPRDAPARHPDPPKADFNIDASNSRSVTKPRQ